MLGLVRLLWCRVVTHGLARMPPACRAGLVITNGVARHECWALIVSSRWCVSRCHLERIVSQRTGGRRWLWAKHFFSCVEGCQRKSRRRLVAGKDTILRRGGTSQQLDDNEPRLRHRVNGEKVTNRSETGETRTELGYGDLGNLPILDDVGTDTMYLCVALLFDGPRTRGTRAGFRPTSTAWAHCRGASAKSSVLCTTLRNVKARRASRS